MTHRTGGSIRRVIVAGCAAALASLALAGNAMADQPSGGGSFVIGDQNASVGTEVTFWGAQWWKDNPLSTGLAPAAFKGYADTATAACGQDWTTDPRISSDPPPTLGRPRPPAPCAIPERLVCPDIAGVGQHDHRGVGSFASERQLKRVARPVHEVHVRLFPGQGERTGHDEAVRRPQSGRHVADGRRGQKGDAPTTSSSHSMAPVGDARADRGDPARRSRANRWRENGHS